MSDKYIATSIRAGQAEYLAPYRLADLYQGILQDCDNGYSFGATKF